MFLSALVVPSLQRLGQEDQVYEGWSILLFSIRIRVFLQFASSAFVAQEVSAWRAHSFHLKLHRNDKVPVYFNSTIIVGLYSSSIFCFDVALGADTVTKSDSLIKSNQRRIIVNIHSPLERSKDTHRRLPLYSSVQGLVVCGNELYHLDRSGLLHLDLLRVELGGGWIGSGPAFNEEARV